MEARKGKEEGIWLEVGGLRLEAKKNEEGENWFEVRGRRRTDWVMNPTPPSFSL